MKPVKNLEGCGTFNAEIKNFIDEQFSILYDYLKSKTVSNINSNPEKRELLKVWLSACLAKTIKEQVGLTKPIPSLVF